ncbi:MAG: preprotein translocase subunit SecG [Dysosmobacter sp.]
MLLRFCSPAVCFGADPSIVLFQSGKSQGLSGAIGGIADSYMSRSKARSVDAKLAKATKWVGAIFVILTLVLNCMVAAGL